MTPTGSGYVTVSARCRSAGGGSPNRAGTRGDSGVAQGGLYARFRGQTGAAVLSDPITAASAGCGEPAVHDRGACRRARLLPPAQLVDVETLLRDGLPVRHLRPQEVIRQKEGHHAKRRVAIKGNGAAPGLGMSDLP